MSTHSIVTEVLTAISGKPADVCADPGQRLFDGLAMDSLLPLLEKAERASVVSLTFDATVAWPVYDWMGPTKAALESITRYLARDLGPSGIRVNAVDSGPIRSMAGKSIPGFDQLADAWPDRAPLGWDTKDSTPVADTVAFFFSDASRMITGQVIHVDGGYGVVGA